ncbi:hypothetical protein CKW48_21420, partial [Bordetella pertussis]
MRDFVSASFDDHVKVFFPPPGAARPVLPELGPDGPTPHLARITLAGDALRDFVSASFDDHVKVFFPPPGAARP